MLRLVARGFFRELVNYGVQREEIVRVASHLLDNLLVQQARRGESFYSDRFTVASVVDEWQASRRLAVQHVQLRPLERGVVPLVARWLAAPSARDDFAPAFPETEAALAEYFARPGVDYFAIYCDGAPVGFVGGENVDVASGKLEMKKLVGETALRGKGIGKRATFGFLYYAFMILGVHKVYLHSRDMNMRNINLNSRFGFELEGVFLEDVRVGERRADLVRMALLKPLWLAIFDQAAPPAAASSVPPVGVLGVGAARRGVRRRPARGAACSGGLAAVGLGERQQALDGFARGQGLAGREARRGRGEERREGEPAPGLPRQELDAEGGHP